MMKRASPLSSTLHWLLPLMGALQGGMLYLLNRTTTLFTTPAEHGWLLFVLVSSLIATATLIFAAHTLRQRWLWLGLALMLAIAAIQCGWLVYAITGLDTWDQRDALWRYVLALSAMLFLTLPWLQSRLAQGRWGDFPAVFNLFWQNGLALLLALLAAGLVWSVLWLCASLFTLIGIPFFNMLFFDNSVAAYVITGCIVAMTVTLCRSHARLVMSVQHLLTLVATGLLPVVGLIMALFILALPGVGLNALSQQVSGAGMLNTLCLVFLLLMALVWHPTRPAPPYNLLMRRFLLGALLLAPLCAIIAAWAVWVRVAQYGWTPDRLYAALVTLVSLLWSVGYVLTLVRQRRSHADFRRTGQAVLIVAPLLIVLLHSPLLSPWRISVNSQMARIEADKTRLDSETLYMLSSSLRWGRAALKTLQNDPTIAGNAVLRQEINTILAGRNSEESALDPDVYRQIPLAAAQPQPDPAYWQALAKSYAWGVNACLPVNKVSNCMLLAKDMNGDGQPEWLLFNFSLRNALVMSREGGKWISVGNFYNLPATLNAATLQEMAQSPRLSTLPPPWRDLSIDGTRLPFAPDRY